MLLGRFYKRPSHDLPTVNNRILTCDMADGNSGTEIMSETKLTKDQKIELQKTELGVNALAFEAASIITSQAETDLEKQQKLFDSVNKTAKDARKASRKAEGTFTSSIRRCFKTTQNGDVTKKVWLEIIETEAPNQKGTFNTVWSAEVAKARAVTTGDVIDQTEQRGQGNSEVKDSLAKGLVSLEAGDSIEAMREINTTILAAVEGTWGKDQEGNDLPKSVMEAKSSLEYFAMLGRVFAAIEKTSRAVSVGAAKVSKNSFELANTSPKAELTDEEQAEIAAAAQAAVDAAKAEQDAKGKGRNRTAATIKDGALV